MKYPRIYRMLVKCGHSKLNASFFVEQAMIGDFYAIEWIKKLFKHRNMKI
jgi:hypothetical protein